jgi:hypothetical protein
MPNMYTYTKTDLIYFMKKCNKMKINKHKNAEIFDNLFARINLFKYLCLIDCFNLGEIFFSGNFMFFGTLNSNTEPLMKSFFPIIY